MNRNSQISQKKTHKENLDKYDHTGKYLDFPSFPKNCIIVH